MNRAASLVVLGIFALLAGTVPAAAQDTRRPVHPRTNRLAPGRTRSDGASAWRCNRAASCRSSPTPTGSTSPPGSHRGGWTRSSRPSAPPATTDSSRGTTSSRRSSGWRRTPRGGRLSPGLRADLDLLATEALTRLAYSLRSGKTDPARVDSSGASRHSLRPSVQPGSSRPLSRPIPSSARSPRSRRGTRSTRCCEGSSPGTGRSTRRAAGLIDPRPNLRVGMTDSRVPTRCAAGCRHRRPPAPRRRGHRAAYDSTVASA